MSGENAKNGFARLCCSFSHAQKTRQQNPICGTVRFILLSLIAILACVDIFGFQRYFNQPPATPPSFYFAPAVLANPEQQPGVDQFHACPNTTVLNQLDVDDCETEHPSLTVAEKNNGIFFTTRKVDFGTGKKSIVPGIANYHLAVGHSGGIGEEASSLNGDTANLDGKLVDVRGSIVSNFPKAESLDLSNQRGFFETSGKVDELTRLSTDRLKLGDLLTAAGESLDGFGVCLNANSCRRRSWGLVLDVLITYRNFKTPVTLYNYFFEYDKIWEAPTDLYYEYAVKARPSYAHSVNDSEERYGIQVNFSTDSFIGVPSPLYLFIVVLAYFAFAYLANWLLWTMGVACACFTTKTLDANESIPLTAMGAAAMPSMSLDEFDGSFSPGMVEAIIARMLVSVFRPKGAIPGMPSQGEPLPASVANRPAMIRLQSDWCDVLNSVDDAIEMRRVQDHVNRMIPQIAALDDFKRRSGALSEVADQALAKVKFLERRLDCTEMSVRELQQLEQNDDADSLDAEPPATAPDPQFMNTLLQASPPGERSKLVVTTPKKPIEKPKVESNRRSSRKSASQPEVDQLRSEIDSLKNLQKIVEKLTDRVRHNEQEIGIVFESSAEGEAEGRDGKNKSKSRNNNNIQSNGSWQEAASRYAPDLGAFKLSADDWLM